MILSDLNSVVNVDSVSGWRSIYGSQNKGLIGDIRGLIRDIKSTV